MTKRIQPEQITAVDKTSKCDLLCGAYNDLAREVNGISSTTIDLADLDRLLNYTGIAQSWLQASEEEMAGKTKDDFPEDEEENKISNFFTAREKVIDCLKVADGLVWDIYDGKIKITSKGRQYETPAHVGPYMYDVLGRIEAVLDRNQIGGWSNVQKPVDGRCRFKNEA